MRKNILKLFYIPIIGFIILTIVYFSALYNIFVVEMKKSVSLLSEKVIKNKKEEIKKDVENFKNFALLIENVVYSFFE